MLVAVTQHVTIGPSWLQMVALVIGIVGAVAFAFGYGNKKRLEGALKSYQDTIPAYTSKIAVLETELAEYKAKSDRQEGALKQLTEMVTQSAKVDLLSHTNEAQHRIILMKLEHIISVIGGERRDT